VNPSTYLWVVDAAASYPRQVLGNGYRGFLAVVVALAAVATFAVGCVCCGQ